MSLLIFLSVILMLMDYHAYHIKPIKKALDWVATPLIYTINWPIKTYHALQYSIATQESLLGENRSLHAEVLGLQLRLQKSLSLEKENKQLRALLSSSRYVHTKVKVGQLVSIASNLASETAMLDLGSNQGAFRGQVILDAFGVFGQINHVSPDLSRVLLLTDSRSAIPVEEVQSGFRAIAAGDGAARSTLHLENVPQTADIKVHDTFVTSGLGGVYPEGYPVGEVLSVEHKPGSQFAAIILKPSAHLHRSRILLFIWPEKEGDTQ
jgi:rod shape-determining protein MreC